MQIKGTQSYTTFLLFYVLFLFTCSSFIFENSSSVSSKIKPRLSVKNISLAAKDYSSGKNLLYDSLQLGSIGLSKEAYIFALNGFIRLQNAGKLQNDSILSIIDFSLPSNRKRLYVINLKMGELLFNTLVSHGKKSGGQIATSFSNKLNSYKSSLGFYITGNTYNGHHGCSLRLEGEEAGINDNALNRGIVMHSAAYVDERFINNQGYIGRSEGCPAIPKEIHKEIIEKIKNGSCLFIYSPDKYYVAHSKMIRGEV